MRILDAIKQEELWLDFREHVESNPVFVDRRLVKRINEIIEKGVNEIDLVFKVPTKTEVGKYKNSKKRTVYSFGEPQNTYLKAINYALQVNDYYRNKFCINSIAYQQGKSVKRYIGAMSREIHMKKYKRNKFIKTDFSDYFNSIDVNILSEKMREFFLAQDADLYELFMGILTNEKVLIDNTYHYIKQKGVMAGLPISGYLANVFMNDVDWEMYRRHIYYTRYADDVIILTDNIERDKKIFIDLLEPLNVTLNPKKIDEGDTNDGVTFLGFYFGDGHIDISRRAIDKMKSRIRRRSKWFSKWLTKNNVRREVAAKTFIKGMNKKLFTRSSEDGTCWMEWYGKNITKVDSLKEIEEYMCQYVRYILSGKQKGYKKNAEIPYETLKKLGYRSLVNEYWKIRKAMLIKEEDEIEQK